MSDHDPCCQWPRLPCQCADFAAARAEARADEREQVVQDITKLVRIVDHAEAVAARLVAVIYEQETEYLATEAWWEETKRQLDDVITAQLLELREMRRQIAAEIREQDHVWNCSTNSNTPGWTYKCDCGIERDAIIAEGRKQT